MSELLVLPLLIPIAALIALFAAGFHLQLSRWINTVASLSLCAAGIALLAAVAAGGTVSLQVGAWPFAFGITLVADLFSAAVVALTGVIAAAVALYSVGSLDTEREASGYYPIYQVMQLGLCGTFLTGDLFNLYVWFEVTLVSSFVLLTLGGERAQLEGAIKYVVLNLFASALFLTAIGLMYGAVGTLNLADISRHWGASAPPGFRGAVLSLLLVAFGIKAAAFPLFFWLPASYHTPPVVISAIFAGLLTKVGVYALIRVVTLLAGPDDAFVHSLILWSGGLTMITGVLGAYAQNDFRRILAFHSISQVGYMLMGLGLRSPLAVGGAVIFMVHHAVVKTNLFLVSGLVYRLRGSYDIHRAGGLYARHPVLTALFLVPALSLAGIPPLSGFFAKLVLFEAGLREGRYAIVATGLVVGLLTLASMVKIWSAAFWPERSGEPRDGPARSRAAMATMFPPVVLLALLAVALGLAAGPVARFAKRTGRQLLDRGDYVRAVSGG